MRTSAELKKLIATAVGSQRSLVEAAEKRGDGFTTEENTTFTTLTGEITTLRAELAQREAYDENIRSLGDKPEARSRKEGGEDAELDGLAKRFSLHRALDMTAEGRALDGAEKEVYDIAAKQARAAGKQVGGFAVPTQISKRFAGQSITQDSGEYGAALVNKDNMGMIDFLRPKPIMETLGATYMNDLQGDASFIVNEGGITAAWEGEVDPGAETKNKYSNKIMKPKRLTAVVPISIQTLRQSSIDLEAYTLKEINAVMANSLDTAVINGTGTNDQPTGIMNAVGVNAIAIGTNGGPLTWAQIVAMETMVFVENANSAKMGYAINSVTKGKLKTTKHEAGDLGYLMAQDNTINGYPVGVTNLVPGNITKGTGTNLSAALFGDFSQVVIGQWGFVDIVVDKSTAASGYYRLIVNGYYDVLVKQPKSFTVIKDISNA